MEDEDQRPDSSFCCVQSCENGDLNVGEAGERTLLNVGEFFL